MTEEDEIIEMAKQAGIEEAYSLKHNQYLVRFKDGSLEAFAKLVAEKTLAEHAMQEVQRLGQEIEQEPVAYPDGDVVGPCICGSWPGGKCLKCPRITTPPQRKPLTDRAITKVIDSMPKKMKGFMVDWDLYEFARAIEAAHGIKENT